MKVECPNCQSTFNLSDEKVGPGGVRVRCGVCKHVFTVDASLTDDFPGFGDSGASPVWPVTNDEDISSLADEKRADPFDSMSVSSKDFTSIDFGSPAPGSSDSSPKKRILIAVLGVLLLACIGVSAAYLFDFWPFAKKVSTSVMEQPVNPEVQQPAPAPSQVPVHLQYLDNLVFGQYEHNVIENEKIGKMLVITGKVVNNAPITVGQIKIEASLLGADDTVMDSQVITAGPTASIVDLKILPRPDLEARLKSIQEVLLNNGTVRPGDEVPFTIVFYQIPEGTKNFALKVVDYMELAQAPGSGQAPASGQPAAK